MKLLSALAASVAAQDYDFYNSGKFGSNGNAVPAGSATNTDSQVDGIIGESGAAGYPIGDVAQAVGHGGNKRYCHSTRANRSVYNWTSMRDHGGFFGEGRNVIECVGEELYCFIEERAHFGQVIGITAGCEQMMNHPAVTIADQQAVVSGYDQRNNVHNNFNRESARGGENQHEYTTFYGIGGCLAMPAQNGHESVQDRRNNDGSDHRITAGDITSRIGTDSAEWTNSKYQNYYRFFHGGYGQNQCLRFNKVGVGRTVNAPANLLPFGVSVCRACCIAEMLTERIDSDLATARSQFGQGVHSGSLCNYAPDSDANIESVTDETGEELVPRFDMKGASVQQFASGSANNLFVHDSWCAAPGPARGCGACTGPDSGYSCTATCAGPEEAKADNAANQADYCPVASFGK